MSRRGSEWKGLAGQCREAGPATLPGPLGLLPADSLPSRAKGWAWPGSHKPPGFLGISLGEPGSLTVVTMVLSPQPDPWNTHVWKGTNGTPTKRRAIGFKKLAE